MELKRSFINAFQGSELFIRSPRQQNCDSSKSGLNYTPLSNSSYKHILYKLLHCTGLLIKSCLYHNAKPTLARFQTKQGYYLNDWKQVRLTCTSLYLKSKLLN